MSNLSILQRFFNECKREWGDVPISITLPSTIYRPLIRDTLERVRFYSHDPEDSPYGHSELKYIYQDRTISILNGERIEDYIESRMGMLMRGDICS